MNEVSKVEAGGGKSEYWLDQFLPDGEEGERRTKALTLPAIRGFLYRQRITMAATLGLVMLAALLFTLLTTPIYQATSTVRVEPYGNNIVEGQDLAPTVPTNEIGRYFFTLGNVVESRSMAYRVVDALSLDERAHFLGDAFAEDAPEGMSEREWARLKREEAAEILLGNVTAVVPRDRGNRRMPSHGRRHRLHAQAARSRYRRLRPHLPAADRACPGAIRCYLQLLDGGDEVDDGPAAPRLIRYCATHSAAA
ncbi:hypothetical protein [Altererythrobacter arenosus]|uniref:hypothetical protein n=1 Tax=Altererythrobacter arenosus TaxID=3032592 RepID=UPI003D3119B9